MNVNGRGREKHEIDRFPVIEAPLGFAATRGGNGVAYARLRSAGSERLIRVPFQVQRCAGLEEREVGYAALDAVASHLRERGVRRVRFLVADGQLVDDVRLRREVPPPIVLPYVRLGCTLNRFERCELRRSGGDADLTRRAQAELY